MAIYSMIFPLFLVSIVVFIVFLVVTAKNNSEMSGEDMIKNVYIYLVLFVTLMMIIGGSVGAFMAIADIVAPTGYYQSYEDYKMRYTEKSIDPGVIEYSLSEEEMKANYDSMVQTELDRQISRAKNSLIKSFGWIVIPFPVFIYFQRKLVKKEI